MGLAARGASGGLLGLQVGRGFGAAGLGHPPGLGERNLRFRRSDPRLESHLQAFARAGTAAWTSVPISASFPWLILLHPAGLDTQVAFSRKLVAPQSPFSHSPGDFSSRSRCRHVENVCLFREAVNSVGQELCLRCLPSHLQHQSVLNTSSTSVEEMNG